MVRGLAIALIFLPLRQLSAFELIWTGCYGPATLYAYPLRIFPGPGSCCPGPTEESTPPSKETKEPPKGDKLRGPILQEIKSVTKGSEPAPSATCRVGFWNFREREVTITVAEQKIVRKVPAKQGFSVDLPREFTWRIDDEMPQLDRVPDNKSEAERIVRPEVK